MLPDQNFYWHFQPVFIDREGLMKYDKENWVFFWERDKGSDAGTVGKAGT